LDRPPRSSFESHVYRVSIFQEGSAGSVANACKLQQQVGARMEDIMDDLDATQAKDGSGTQASTGRSTAGTSEDGKKVYRDADR
jgi:hypothetical protein